MHLIKHDFGSVIAIGIQDNNKDQIEFTYFSFWNHGATQGDLEWVKEDFAFFWTTPRKLRKSLIQSSLFQLLNIDGGRAKGKKHGLMPEALRIAKQRFEEIENVHFLNTEQEQGEEYKMGYLNFETPDLIFY